MIICNNIYRAANKFLATMVSHLLGELAWTMDSIKDCINILNLYILAYLPTIV